MQNRKQHRVSPAISILEVPSHRLPQHDEMTIVMSCIGEVPAVADVISQFRTTFPEAHFIVYHEHHAIETQRCALAVGAATILHTHSDSQALAAEIVAQVRSDLLLICDPSSHLGMSEVENLISKLHDGRPLTKASDSESVSPGFIGSDMGRSNSISASDLLSGFDSCQVEMGRSAILLHRKRLTTASGFKSNRKSSVEPIGRRSDGLFVYQVAANLEILTAICLAVLISTVIGMVLIVFSGFSFLKTGHFSLELALAGCASFGLATLLCWLAGRRISKGA